MRDMSIGAHGERFLCAGKLLTWGVVPGRQMAARETGFGAVEQFMHAGKLLALELLVRALESPHHHWVSLRSEVRHGWMSVDRAAGHAQGAASAWVEYQAGRRFAGSGPA